MRLRKGSLGLAPSQAEKSCCSLELRWWPILGGMSPRASHLLRVLGTTALGYVPGQSSQAAVAAGRAQGVERDVGFALTGGTEPRPSFQPAVTWSPLIIQMLHQFGDASFWQGWRK